MRASWMAIRVVNLGDWPWALLGSPMAMETGWVVNILKGRLGSLRCEMY